MTPAPVPITARAVGTQKAYIHLRPLFTSARPLATSVSSLARRLSQRASDCARRVSHLLSSSERRRSHLALKALPSVVAPVHEFVGDVLAPVQCRLGAGAESIHIVRPPSPQRGEGDRG